MFADYNDDEVANKMKNRTEYPVRFENIGTDTDVPVNTLHKMSDIIKSTSKNFLIIEWARAIVDNCESKDSQCELETLYDYVRDHCRYVRDTNGTEVLQTPMVAYDKIINKSEKFDGDCDCLTMFILSLMKCLGYNVKLIAAGYKQPGNYTHVYGNVNTRGKWVVVEPIKFGVQLGWEAPGRKAMMEMEVK